MAKRYLWVVELKMDGAWTPISYAFFTRASARLKAKRLTSGDTRVVRYSVEDQ